MRDSSSPSDSSETITVTKRSAMLALGAGILAIALVAGVAIAALVRTTDADTLIGAFYSEWDQAGVNLVGNLMYGGGAPYRLQASEIAGIFVDQDDTP